MQEAYLIAFSSDPDYNTIHVLKSFCIPETVLYGYNIFVVGHAVPGVIGLQNLHGHLTFNLSYS